jgi:hypothetical protein
MLQDLYAHGLIGGGTREETGWTRPADWLTIPLYNPNEQVIYILTEIIENTSSNFVAFTVIGDYTVDWGDGVIENYDSGDKAEHQYSWNDISDDTIDSNGYKQAIIKVIPNNSNITDINFNQKYSTFNEFNNYYGYFVREIIVNCSYLENLIIGNWTASSSYPNLKRFELGENNISNCEGLLAYLYSIKEISVVGNMDHVINADWMFAGNYSLEILNVSDMPNCTSAVGMFAELFFLKQEMNINLQSCEDCSYMYAWCYNLKQINNLNLPNMINGSFMFNDCFSLEYVNQIDLASCTNSSSMFKNCKCLINIDILNTQNLLACQGMLSGADNIKYVPNIDLTNIQSPFSAANDAVFTGLSITKIDAYNIGFSIVLPHLLDRDNIINVFNNLSPGSRTINVQSCIGAVNLSSDDIQIATDKGWTVLT